MDGSIVARYSMDGNLVPGHLVKSRNKGYFAYLSSIALVKSCDYLVMPSGYSGRLEWISGRPGEVPCGGLVGGHSADGTDLLYLARVNTTYGLTKAAYSVQHKCAYYYNLTGHYPDCSSEFYFLDYTEGEFYITFQSARSPDCSRCKRGLSVQFAVHFNHFQMTNL